MKIIKTFLNFTINESIEVETRKIPSDDEIISTIKSKDSKNIPSLLKSCITDLNAVKLCLNNGLDPDFDDGLPLRLAIKAGSLDVVKLLLSNPGVKRDSHIIRWAYEYDNQNIIDYLIQAGFNKDFDKAITWIEHSSKLSPEKKTQMIEDIKKMIDDGTVTA